MGLFGPSAEEIADRVVMIVNQGIAGALGIQSKLPQEASDDDFLTAYMFGALLNGYLSAGIKNPRKQQRGAERFFGYYFGDEGWVVGNQCYLLIEQSAEFKSNARLGAKETAEFIAGAGSLERLRAHLGSTYQQ